jgi:hypothetical protein
MMNGAQKSDSPTVPGGPVNNTGQPGAEPVEGSGGIERNAGVQSTVWTQSREAVSQAQARIREAVNRNQGEKLTALLHHVTIDCLRWAFLQLKKNAAPGVDGTRWEDYARGLEGNLGDLHRRVHTGAYRAQPSRRKYIPKADGRQRPLGIAALEDKIVQQAVVMILTPIYESAFLGFSYGFRAGRSQHDALDALAFGIKAKKICWILDADIARFFDTISHEWLIRKARKAIKAKVREIIRHGGATPVKVLVERINAALAGWVNYFRVGNSSRAFSEVRDYVEMKVRTLLTRRKRQRKRSVGWRRWSNVYLYEVLGLYWDWKIHPLPSPETLT